MGNSFFLNSKRIDISPVYYIGMVWKKLVNYFGLARKADKVL
jgi:hypothetical protein